MASGAHIRNRERCRGHHLAIECDPGSRRGRIDDHHTRCCGRLLRNRSGRGLNDGGVSMSLVKGTVICLSVDIALAAPVPIALDR